MEAKILKFAQDYFDSGIKSVGRLGEWEGYAVYEMVGDTIFFTGMPTYVLVQGDKMRLTTEDESLGLLGGMLGDSEGDF